MNGTTIDIQGSIDLSGGRITKTFLARTMGRPTQTIYQWIKNGKIPVNANIRLISLFRENGVEPVFLNPTP